MVIRSKTTRNYRRTRAETFEPQITPEEEQKIAFEELQAAKKRFQEAVYNNRHKSTNREELTTSGKTILKGAGRLVDDFLDGSSRIGESIERDIRRHSVQGKIDNTIIRALMDKNKKSGGRTASKRPKIWVEVTDASGRPAFINVKDIPAALRKRGR